MNAPTTQPSNPKYLPLRALRPFSLSVSVVACLLGISIAAGTTPLASLDVAMVMVAGILLQAGVNLINDQADLRNNRVNQQLSASDIQHIQRNHRYGLGCFLLATLLGVVLAWRQDWWLLCLGAFGIAGALFYTKEPINYKNRGLGVALVFCLMGELMVLGAAWAVGAPPSATIMLQAIPLSLLTAALLLANELRDFEADSAQQIQTLSVRIGFGSAALLYTSLLGISLIVLILLWIADLQPWPLLPAASLTLAYPALKLLRLPASRRRPLPPATGRLLLAFGLAQSLSFWIA